MKKAMIAMSGGVDSSVAAWLMKRDGYDCMGVTMRLFAGEDSCERKGHTCCSLDDVEDARSVARQLGIPYFVFNFTEDFGTQIMDRFVCAYENGFTPNPCIDCNRYMKFEKLMKRAKELDISSYTRLEQLFILTIQEVISQSGVNLQESDCALLLSTTKGNIDLLSDQEKRTNSDKPSGSVQSTIDNPSFLQEFLD